ncbi:hypothetical protein D3C86_1713680 [compost metagenome]
MFGHLLEGQRLAAPSQVLDRATDGGGLGFSILEHGNVQHALVLAAHQVSRLGDVRLQECRGKGAVVHCRVAEFFLALGLGRIGSHGRYRQAQAEQKQSYATHVLSPRINRVTPLPGDLAGRGC